MRPTAANRTLRLYLNVLFLCTV